MSRMVRDFIQIRGVHRLDALIERLTAARRALPAGAEAIVQLVGDDTFGRLLSISYFRPQTAEEAGCDARYSDAYLESLLARLARLEEEIELEKEQVGGACERLRIAA